MAKNRIILALITIICFFLGFWPISLATLGILIFMPKELPSEKQENEPTMEELKAENEILRKELGEQAVRHAIEKADSREKNG